MNVSSSSSKALFESLFISTTTTKDPTSSDHETKGRDDISNNKTKTNKKPLRKQMTSIGRFSLSSQTEQNPSIISFFVTLVHKEGDDMNIETFKKLWSERIMSKYERFRFHVSDEDSRYFESNDASPTNFISRVEHPTSCFKERIESMLMAPMDVTRGLWDLQLSSGSFGSSGALKTQEFPNRTAPMTRESLLLFRVHHSLCDGVSLSVAIGELADEAKELQEKVTNEISRRLQKKKSNQEMSIIVTLIVMIVTVIRFLLFAIFEFSLQLWRVATATSPFDNIMKASSIPPGKRSVSWRHLGTLEEIKTIAKNIKSSMTVNDLAVHLVTYAIQCQLDKHLKMKHDKIEKDYVKDYINRKNQTRSVNIVIPVHLNGGFIQGNNLGNKIGAFVSTVPLPTTNGLERDSFSRAAKISEILHRSKSSPAAIISWWLAKLSSSLTPDWWTKFMMRKFNAKSVAVVSNVKGWPFQVHWLGRRVGYLCAFLPLPPGVPIGIVIQSYEGEVSFSVNADKRAVPDAEKFADWMLHEYNNIVKNLKLMEFRKSE